MTLSTVNPTDQELNARWPYWIRTLAAAINSIVLDPSSIAVTDLVVAAGDTLITVGVELSDNWIEVVFISSAGEAELEHIRNGTSGQIKIFVAQDDEVSFLDGIKADGHVYLNQVALTPLNMNQDDVLVLLNVGGDGLTVHGYWIELLRNLTVK